MPRLSAAIPSGLGAGVLLLAVVPSPAMPASAGEEYLSVIDAVEPNILFLLDRSVSMSLPCPVAPGEREGVSPLIA